MHYRLSAGAVAATLALAPVAAFPAAAGAAKHKKHYTAPKAGAKYKGKTSDGGPLTLNVASSKSIQIVAFRFNCKKVPGATGNTSLQSIKIKKTSKGYKFGITAFGIVGYSDNDTLNENGKITISGKFSTSAKRVSGHLRVKTPRCGDTGSLGWSAKKQ